jgi:UDP-4-amino-4,6-dideoxy-N-acetyl-beta-L-altrosamine transaminase
MVPIPYGRQDISREDIEAVNEVLLSDNLTQGPTVERFENAIAHYCGAKYGVAVNSATSALHIACLALELMPGDLVWTTPITFVATANCALYCGAKVDFVDIELDSYGISLEKLSNKLEQASKNGGLPKILIPVHFAGQPSNMVAIYELSKKYGFKIIEDASHALGASHGINKVGSCVYSDITVFSFHPVKMITTGEGGMAVTNNPKLAELMYRYRTHGIESNPKKMIQRPEDEIWNYQQQYLGFNYRMTDIQAALGISQLKRLNEFTAKRNEIANQYNKNLIGLPLITPWKHPDTFSSYHLYVVRLKTNEIKLTQGEIFKQLRSEGILVNLHYIPVYRQPFYEAMGFYKGYCPNAEEYFQSALSLPIFFQLTNNEIAKINSTLEAILR